MPKFKKNLTFKNPVIAAQVLESPFIADSYQGHTMPPGKDFIGEKNYIGMEELIEEVKKSKKKVILNIGDSSTSGWDSNIVTQNRERMAQGSPLIPAFFQYKTYSDYLRELIGNEYMVINAGVPAHTSLQGRRRIEVLLNRFKNEGLPIQWVTAYYGNNDSVWDHNRQDKEWVGRKKSLFINWLSKRFKSKDSSIITRVSADDYKLHMKEIVHTCQHHSVKIIIIEPMAPIYWKPGTRVSHEDLDRRNYPGSSQAYKLLDEARALWVEALKQDSYSDLKRIALEEVREKDYIVPRIKREHLAALRSLFQEMDVPYIHLDLDRSENDIRYFIDYCHPIHEANELIASNIAAIVSGQSSGKENFLIKKDKKKPSSEKSEVALELPTDHYTLY